MSKLSRDIQSVIKKNLPAEVAETLREYIEQAEADKERIEELEANNEELHAANLRLGKDAAAVRQEMQEKEARHRDLERREKDVTEREIKQDVREANLRCEEAQKRANDLFRLSEIVFKNPVVKRSLYQGDVYRQDYLNGQQVQTKTGHSATEEVTEE